MPVTAIDRAAEERRFYGRMAIAMAAIIFIGFAPSFYLRGLVPFPRPNPSMTPLILAHGIVFTAWIALFYAQARLVAANRRDIHMRLGLAGFGLGLVMLVMMVLVSVQQVARATQPPYIDPVSFSAVPLVSIPTFAIFLWMGWANRRNAQVHKRFMLLSALFMMEPAIGRMIFFPPSYIGQYASSIVAWAMVIPLILWDRRVIGVVHWATRFGAILMAVTLIVRFLVWETKGWHAFVQVLTG
jgi:hypothetical protein